MKTDQQGRVIVAPHDVRGAIFSANVSIANGTPTNFILGDSDYFLDIVEMTFANTSSASMGLDVTNDGTLSRHVEIPANSTIQLQFDVPLKQTSLNTPWNIDGPDVTNSTVQVGGMYIKKDIKVN